MMAARSRLAKRGGGARALVPALAAAAWIAAAAQAPGVALADPPAPSASAAAQAAGATAEVIVLHATNDGTGIDPKIGKMPELGRPPFSSYNSYKLLDRASLALAKGEAKTTKLPNNRVLQVTLKDILGPKKKGEGKKYALSASIQKPGGGDFLPLLNVNAPPGETFFVAGQTYKGGILVIGIKVAP
jgi:hypothetical protein